jgi:ATP-dependent exoDNAse (exonuclease V) beta subunit
VSLVMSALRLADHPGDSVARAHVVTSPLAAEFGDLQHDNDTAASRQSRRVRRALLDDGYGETILRWALRLAPSCDPRDARRLDQLTDVAFAYEPIATLRPADFIRHVELQRVVDPGAARVRVMTIHQSKGLEFDAVVMAAPSDTLNRAPKIVASSPNPFEAIDHVLRYANESLQSLLPRTARQTIESHKTNEAREQLNVLYVAMTRAAGALHIVVPPQSKANDSWACLLRHALAEKAEAEPGAVLFELGSAQWYQDDAGGNRPHKRHRSTATQTPAPNDEQSAESRKMVFAASQRAEVLRHTTPSGGGDVSSLDVSSVLSFKSRAARQRGSLFHVWLEMVQWLDAGLPTDDDLARAAKRFHLRHADIERHISEFRAWVAQPNVSCALSRFAYTGAAFAEGARQSDSISTSWTIWTELPFSLTTHAGWTTGRFDRLVVLQDGDRAVAADVIDFKTDAIEQHDNEALAVATASHRAQMQAYGRAACKLFQLPLPRVRLRLLFVTADAVVDVAHADVTE